MIIGISGKLGTGKSFYSKFIIDHIRENYPNEPVIELAFADQIKVNTIVKYNTPRHQVYTMKTDQSRRLLQLEGTENGRLVSGPDIWVKYMQEWIYLMSQRGIKHFVISDVRFTNEAQFIQSQESSLLVRINATSRNETRLVSEYTPERRQEIQNHPSECNLDSFNFHYTLFNDSTTQTKYNQDFFKNFIHKQLTTV
jgi:hypothetical protein